MSPRGVLCRPLLLVALATAAFSSTPVLSSVNYMITDLGTLGGDFSKATDLNEAGQVVGVSRTSDGSERAFLWETGVMKDLGTLGGTSSHASAVNESGEIVGWAETADGTIRACLFGSITNTDLSGGRPDNSFAADINDEGHVVGWLDPHDPSYRAPRAYAFRPSVRDLSHWGGLTVRSSALAINNRDQLVGWSEPAVQLLVYPAPPSIAATRWPGFTDIRTDSRLGGAHSEAYDLNGSGEVVGQSDFSYVPSRASRWSGTNRMSLGSLALGTSAAQGINNQGQIVGNTQAFRFGAITNRLITIPFPGPGSSNSPPPEPVVYDGYTLTKHAFIWRDGLMSDLNDLVWKHSGWELLEATAINDAGQIVGTGRINGENRAFLLTPRHRPNGIPFVELVTPAEGEWVEASDLALRAEAFDRDGHVHKVEFFAHRVYKRQTFTGIYPGLGLHSLIPFRPVEDPQPPGYVGESMKSPYELNVTNLPAGNYLVMAKATDNRGATTCTPEVLIRVNAPPALRLSSAPPSPPIGTGWEVGSPTETPLGDGLTLWLSGFNEELDYDIETSSDLIHWTRVGVIKPSTLPPYTYYSSFGNPTTPTIAINPTNSHGYYRAVAGAR